LAAGKGSDAVALFDEVRKAPVPAQRKLEATRGAILARGDDGAALLVEQLQSPEQSIFRLGLTTAREVKPGKCDTAIVAELPKLPAGRAALVLRALADRKSPAAVEALVAAAAKGSKETRLAALESLGAAGNASALAVLLEGAADADADLARAATASISSLSGAEVDAEIKKRLPAASGKLLPMLLELVGQRRIDSIPPALAAVDSQDPATRAAALAALGNIVDVERLPVLVAQVVKPRDDADAANARKALLTAAIRMPDREACAAAVTGALAQAPAPAKQVLLETLGQVGGTKALAAVAAAAKNGDDAQKDVASRLLGEWMTADAAPVLLDLSKSLAEDKYRGRAIRGFIRIARQFKLEQAERSKMAVAAFAATKTPAERKLVLEVARRYPDIEMLKLAAKAGAEEEIKPEARIAAAAIVKKLPEESAEAYALAKGLGLEKVKLEIVKASYGSGDRQKDVTDVVRKNAGSLPLIFIPGDGFNKVFGGDPAPNAEKHLSIDYTIDGKAGTAKIGENGTILLPTP
jgi:HEAT repeat protein